MAQRAVLPAKLTAPDATLAVHRPRVYEALDRARNRRAVWITGPAGAGKSTVVAAYAAARSLPCFWYSVDSRDNDVASLFSYLSELAAHFGRSAPEPLPPLAMDHPVGGRAFARRFFESLFERLPSPCLLVFDDAQVVAPDDRWFDLLREGLHAVPSDDSVVVVSRTAPPASLSGFVASSRLAALGWDDIRFTDAEAVELVQSRAAYAGRPVSPDGAAQLAEMAQGWAAAVVLAIECTNTGPKPTPSRSTTREQIFDFFAAEVFAAESESMRRFLLESALLPFMTVQLLEQLDLEGSRALSSQLRRGGYFVTEYARAPETWRFHPLFREFLLSRAETDLTPEELRSMHTRVAGVLESEGEFETAFELYARASAWEAATAIALREAPGMIHAGRARTVRSLIARIPEAEATPWLSLWNAAAALGTEPDESHRLLEGALDRFRKHGDAIGYWSAWCARAQAIQLACDDIRPLRALVDRAIEAMTELAFPTVEIESRVTRNIALALSLLEPQTRDQLDWLERAVAIPPEGDPEALALAWAAFGFQGDFARLRQTLDRWQRSAESRPSTVIGRLLVSQIEALCALAAGEFASAQEHSRSGLTTAEAFGVYPANGTLLNIAGYAHLAVGEVGAAELVADDLLQATGQQTLGLAAYHHVSARAALAGGNARLALEHSERGKQLVDRHGWVLARALAAQSLAEITWRLGDIERATRLLIAAEEHYPGAGVVAWQEGRLLGAAFAASRGQNRQADDLLDEALALGERDGFFPFDGPDRATLRTLCERAVERRIRPQYVAEIVNRFALDVSSMPRAPTDSPPDDFQREVKSALRNLHETHKLCASSLISSPVIERRAGSCADAEARVDTLRRALRSIVSDLADNARTERMHRALVFAYLEPSGTQLLAAERAHMSFGSFRRHLAAGLQEVALRLWMDAGD